MDIHKRELVKTKWAEISSDLLTLSDDELIQRITEYEDALTIAHTAFECAKTERHRRVQSGRTKFAEEQREKDRTYIPKPADRLAFDKKAREERKVLSAEDKAIEKLMAFGLSREDAVKTITDGKAKA